MKWFPNKQLQAAILNRLGVLLGTNRPASVLALMVTRESVKFPYLRLSHDYSVIEDICVQKIICKYQDHRLDQLWTLYNFNYFQEDTYENL